MQGGKPQIVHTYGKAQQRRRFLCGLTINVPYQRDCLKRAQGTVWHSGLGKPYPNGLQELMGKLFHTERQAQIDVRAAEHNHLHLHDFFDELRTDRTTFHG